MQAIVHPDPEIFKNVLEFSFEQLATKLEELSYLNSRLEIEMIFVVAALPSEPGWARGCGRRPRRSVAATSSWFLPWVRSKTLASIGIRALAIGDALREAQPAKELGLRCRARVSPQPRGHRRAVDRRRAPQSARVRVSRGDE